MSPSRLEAATASDANARLGAQDANVTREEWLRDATERLARMEMRAEFDKEPCACFRCGAQGLVIQSTACRRCIAPGRLCGGPMLHCWSSIWVFQMYYDHFIREQRKAQIVSGTIAIGEEE